MGMFDNIKAPLMGCPGCGADLDFQTKDDECTLSTFTVEEVLLRQREDSRGRRGMRMVGGCERCRWWIEVQIETGNDPFDYDAWRAALDRRNSARLAAIAHDVEEKP
jgi:hypothetical protein